MTKQIRTYLILLVPLLVIIPGILFAQQADSTQTDTTTAQVDDPFENKPLFTKPAKELVKKPPSEWIEKEDVQRAYRSISQSGLDFKDTFGTGAYNSPLVYNLYPVLPVVHYNRVNGFTLGLQKDRMKWHSGNWLFDIPGITWTGGASYAFGLDEWQYRIGLEKYFGRREHVMMGAEFHDATTTDDHWRVGLNETTLTSLITSHDFLDYYNQDGFGLYAAFRTDRFWEFSVSYNDDDYESLQQQTEFSMFGKDKSFRPNPAVDSTNIQSLSFAASFNPKKLIVSKIFTLTTDVLVELGDISSFDNEFEFNRYELESKLFFRIDRSTTLNIRVKAGSITGNAPQQRLYELGGIGTLRTRGFKEFRGNNQMLLANTELQFGQPDWTDNGWIDLSSLYLSLFVDSGWTQFEDSQLKRTNPLKGFRKFNLDDLKNDFGVGIGSNLFRFEIAWPTEDFGRSPSLWIRLNPTF